MKTVDIEAMFNPPYALHPRLETKTYKRMKPSSLIDALNLASSDHAFALSQGFATKTQSIL